MAIQTDFRANEPRQGYDQRDESVFRAQVELALQQIYAVLSDLEARIAALETP